MLITCSLFFNSGKLKLTQTHSRRVKKRFTKQARPALALTDWLTARDTSCSSVRRQGGLVIGGQPDWVQYFQPQNKPKSYHRRSSLRPSRTGDRDDADTSLACQSNISVDPQCEGKKELLWQAFERSSAAEAAVIVKSEWCEWSEDWLSWICWKFTGQNLTSWQVQFNVIFITLQRIRRNTHLWLIQRDLTLIPY